MRGGYGLYWAPQFAIGSPYNPPGFTATTSYVASNDGNATPANIADESVSDRRWRVPRAPRWAT